jgi:hypothetical protein
VTNAIIYIIPKVLIITPILGDSNCNIEPNLIFKLNRYNNYITKHVHLPPCVSTCQKVKLT